MVKPQPWLTERQRSHRGATPAEVDASLHSRLLQKAAQGDVSYQRHSESCWWILIGGGCCWLPRTIGAGGKLSKLQESGSGKVPHTVEALHWFSILFFQTASWLSKACCAIHYFATILRSGMNPWRRLLDKTLGNYKSLTQKAIFFTSCNTQ